MLSTLPNTAIVTAYQRVDQTRATLRRILECVPPPAEIVVHVDGNQTGTAGALGEAFPGVRVLLSAENLGPGGGRNKLVAAASHPIVASFDDDSYPLDADYFARVAAVLGRHPEAAVITGRVFERGAAIEPAADTAEWVADFSGGACAYRREVFLKTGGYVPLPVAYGMEEVDLALRLHAQGGRVLQSRWLRVFHDTDLSRHASPSVTAASISNLALLTYLRYPRRLWPIGAAQCVNRALWLVRHRRLAGILMGLIAIPRVLVANRGYVARLPARAVHSYLKLRRSPSKA